jgi:hypothetical protein
VACYLAMALAYPAIAMPLFRFGPANAVPLFPSPFFGIFVPTIDVDNRSLRMSQECDPIHAFTFLAFEAIVAFVLLRIALGSFDRRLGRVVDRSRTVDRKLEPFVELVGEPKG